jgi:CRISPR-associated protein Cmr4
MNSKLIFVHALSPLHAGTGQGVGVIDLPIAREKATGLPYLPGSSLKGTLRDLCQDSRKKEVFGPDTANAAEHAGSAQFSDQRLLLLPVRSLKGTFAWVTSPYLLQRFVREARSADLPEALPASKLPMPQGIGCLVAEKDCALTQEPGDKPQVILEDLDLGASASAAVSEWGVWIARRIFAQQDQVWRDYFTSHLCFVSDDVLSFLIDTATEITARIKLIPDKKTVQKGRLWYEEALPAETVLSGLLVATKVQVKREDDVFEVVRDTLTQYPTMQLGGKATVGRGLCCVRLADKEANK